MNKNNSRWIEPLLSKALSVFPVVVVAGARQVGKTTLVRELCPGPQRKYYTLDSLDILVQAKESPDSLLENLPVTLDEVQRAPELLLAVKRAVDRGRVAGGILLTGSANFSLLRSVADSLAGRAVKAPTVNRIYQSLKHLEDHIIAVARRWSDPAKVASLIHEWMRVEVNAIAKTKSLLAR